MNDALGEFLAAYEEYFAGERAYEDLPRSFPSAAPSKVGFDGVKINDTRSLT